MRKDRAVVQPQTLKGRKLCTFTARDFGEDPVPSAVRWQRCLAIEVETPWSKELTDSAACPPEVDEAVKRAESRGETVRLQGLMKDAEYSVDGHTRIIDVSRSDTSAGHQSTEYIVPTLMTGHAVEVLLTEQGAPAELEAYRRDIGEVRDILVCTHGSRDACCARFGYEIYRRLRDEYAPASGGRLRVWRTSHTGGHRFAPTLIDLPEGRYWAWIGLDHLDSLINRSGPIEDLIEHYRGWAALDTPFEQMVEREAFRREGWSWTGRETSSRVIDTDEAESVAEVQFDFRPANGSDGGSYLATVRRLEDIVTTGCASAELGKTVVADQYATERFEPRV